MGGREIGKGRKGKGKGGDFSRCADLKRSVNALINAENLSCKKRE